MYEQMCTTQTEPPLSQIKKRRKMTLCVGGYVPLKSKKCQIHVNITFGNNDNCLPIETLDDDDDD
jgi:hypothetical protein